MGREWHFRTRVNIPFLKESDTEDLRFYRLCSAGYQGVLQLLNSVVDQKEPETMREWMGVVKCL